MLNDNQNHGFLIFLKGTCAKGEWKSRNFKQHSAFANQRIVSKNYYKVFLMVAQRVLDSCHTVVIQHLVFITLTVNLLQYMYIEVELEAAISRANKRN